MLIIVNLIIISLVYIRYSSSIFNVNSWYISKYTIDSQGKEKNMLIEDDCFADILLKYMSSPYTKINIADYITSQSIFRYFFGVILKNIWILLTIPIISILVYFNMIPNFSNIYLFGNSSAEIFSSIFLGLVAFNSWYMTFNERINIKDSDSSLLRVYKIGLLSECSINALLYIISLLFLGLFDLVSNFSLALVTLAFIVSLIFQLRDILYFEYICKKTLDHNLQDIKIQNAFEKWFDRQIN